MTEKKAWFARHKTARQLVWVAVAVVVVFFGIEMLGEGFVRAVIIAFARKFEIEIEVP